MGKLAGLFGKLAFLVGLSAPFLLAGAAIAEDVPSVKQFTQATHTWGQALIDQKLKRVQHRLSADIICNYENQLAKNTAYTIYQAELIANIEEAPAHLVIDKNNTLAVVCPRVNQVSR